MVKRSAAFAGALATAMLALAWIASASGAVAPNTPLDRLEVVLEPTAASPYPGEMLVLKARTTLFGKTVALEHLDQPSLQNFAWIQLTADRWFSTEVAGVQALRFERVLALFATRSGSLTIDAFVHHLTVTEDNNARRMLDLHSAPVEVDVQQWAAPHGGPNAADPWWLPAKSITVIDHWEPDPEQIPPGETARRTTVIEAVGLCVERLPPEPKLRSSGVITFLRILSSERLFSVPPGRPLTSSTAGMSDR